MAKKKDDPGTFRGVPVEVEPPLPPAATPGTDTPPARPLDRPAAAADGDDRPPAGWADPSWPDRLMARLTRDEVVVKGEKTYPRVDGLWRLVEVVLGPVVGYVPKVVRADDRSATVEVTLTVRRTDGTSECYGGVAGASPLSLEKGFDRFPEAVAETRAKGRACRTALRLYRQVTAEELVENPARDPDEPRTVTSAQVNALDLKGAELDLDVREFLRWVARERKIDTRGVTRVGNLPWDLGLAAMKVVSEIQQGRTEPPQSCRGYKPDWQN